MFCKQMAGLFLVPEVSSAVDHSAWCCKAVLVWVSSEVCSASLCLTKPLAAGTMCRRTRLAWMPSQPWV